TYLAVLGFFALGLMSKPMLVTLPFVLLLLDFWPLGRLKNVGSLIPLVREKIPLIILTGISSVVTFFMQRAGGALFDLYSISIPTRIANAFVAYFVYLWRLLWPAKLAVLYPVRYTVNDWWWVAALGL